MHQVGLNQWLLSTRGLFELIWTLAVKNHLVEPEIAFFDIGVNDVDQDLAIPYQIAEIIFSPAYKG